MACRRFLLTPVTLLRHNYNYPITKPPFHLIQRSYKSSISIDKLYPNSDEDAFTKVVQVFTFVLLIKELNALPLNSVFFKPFFSHCSPLKTKPTSLVDSFQWVSNHIIFMRMCIKKYKSQLINPLITLHIHTEKLTITHSKSSGPGGMNVNKLNTKATVQFKVSEATWIPDSIRTTFIDKVKSIYKHN